MFARSNIFSAVVAFALLAAPAAAIAVPAADSVNALKERGYISYV
jgi:hypothetical protein